MIKHHIKLKVTATIVALAIVCFSAVGIFRAFATTASVMLSYVTSGEVSLDGTSGAQVTVSLTAAQAGKLYVAQGRFSTTETDDSLHYFSINSLTPGSVISGYSLDNSSSTGQYYYKYSQAGDGVEFAAGDHIYELVYNVDAETPAGTYHLPIAVEYVQQTSLDDYEEEVVVEAVVTVTRNETPATKPSQVVTFVTGGNTIGSEGVTKAYGDADFIVTKSVTTGDGNITEYHPDDDGTGSIAHTDPSNDYVGVGIPGDVNICAWVEETENYAATKACYTVHVTKRNVAVTGVTIADKSYDGMTGGTTTNVVFSNQTESATLTSSDYTTDTVFEDADAGEDKDVTVTVTLVGDAVDHYTLASNTFNTTKTITPYMLTADNVALNSGSTYTYDPNGVEPAVTVTANTHGGISTLGSSDYEVSYGNNDAVGTGHVFITGKNNFTTGDNPVIVDFTITKRAITNDDMTVPSSIVEGRILEASDVSLNVNGHTLTMCANDGDTNCDYVLSITGDNDGQIGHTVTVTASGRNNYNGTSEATVSIVAKLPQTVTISDVTNTTVNKSYGDADFTYAASTDGDGAISYQSSNNTVASVDANGKVTINDVGEVDITATASETDTYASASASYHLNISKKIIGISSATVSNKTYDGNNSASVITASLSESSLTFNTDFTASAIFSGVDTGERVAIVTITLGSDTFAHYCFSGSESCNDVADIVTTGTIAPFTLGADNTTANLTTSTFEYDGTAKTPSASVTVDLDGDGTKETALTVENDYAISYSDNINAGYNAKATISGTGNYQGSLPALEFSIDAFALNDDNSTATLSENSYEYDGSAKEPTVSLSVDLDGDSTKETTLTAGTDFTVSYNNNTNAGTATVTVSGAGNYSGSLSAIQFTINKAPSGNPAEISAGLSGVVGTTLADLGDLSEGFAWVDPTAPITAGMNEYSATYTKNGDTTNYATANVSIPVIGYTEEYEVIRGDGQNHIIGVDGAAEFEIDADYELFEEGGAVYVDNVLVETPDYDSWSGSTIISLSQEYLDSLELGEHTLAVLFNDGGLARAIFTVSEPEPEPTPEAADTGMFTSVAGGAIATGSVAVVIIALATTAYVTVKRRN